MLLLAAGSGALAGLLIGVTTVKQMAEAERARERRHALRFTNELLRHNVLNGMQVILAASDQLKEHVNEAETANIDRIQDRSRTIVDLVQNVRMLMKSTSGEFPLDTVNLSTVLAETIETADNTYEHAQFESEIPSQIFVQADPLLDAVFENVLANAVEHNDTENPRVDISVTEQIERVCVTIADNGPGIPDGKKEAYLKPGEQGDGSVGQGLGLYLIDTLVDRYDGEISIEDNDPRGTIVRVTLEPSDPDDRKDNTNMTIGAEF
jgi:signal transduction histidine kinase